jgi:hypothetical protein
MTLSTRFIIVFQRFLQSLIISLLAPSRALDSMVRECGYRLHHINNLKLARFKAVFPGSANPNPTLFERVLIHFLEWHDRE